MKNIVKYSIKVSHNADLIKYNMEHSEFRWWHKRVMRYSVVLSFVSKNDIKLLHCEVTQQ